MISNVEEFIAKSQEEEEHEELKKTDSTKCNC